MDLEKFLELGKVCGLEGKELLEFANKERLLRRGTSVGLEGRMNSLEGKLNRKGWKKLPNKRR